MDDNESNDGYCTSGNDEDGESDNENNRGKNSGSEDDPSDGDHCDNAGESDNENNSGNNSGSEDDPSDGDHCDNADSDENTEDVVVEDDDNRNNSRDNDECAGNHDDDATADITVSTCKSPDSSVNSTDQNVEAEVNILCMPSVQVESVRESNPPWKRKYNKGPKPYGKKWGKNSSNDKRCYNVQNKSGDRAVDKGENDGVAVDNATNQGNPIYGNGNKRGRQRSQGKGCQSYNSNGKFHENVGNQNSLLCNDGRGTPKEGKMLGSNCSSNQELNLALDNENRQNHGSSNKNNSNKNHMSNNNNNNKSNSYHNNSNNKNSSNNYNNNNNNKNSNNSNNNNNNNNKNSFTKNSNSSSNNSSSKKGDEHSKDLIRLAKDIISPFWKKKAQPEPVDSIVLKLHYRLSVCLFVIFFTFVQANWYLKESIECISGHNPHIDIPFRLKNFCLSYSYICEFDTGQCTRRYILFYRWIYMCFLLVAPLYYLPRIVAKKVMNPRLKKLLADLACDEERYDDSTWEVDSQKMLKYMHSHRERNSQYIWLILCHGIALSIDVAVFVFFDFLLHNRFLGFLYYAYPYHRSLPYFTDYMSQTFPPVANCTVHVGNLINNYREETFGCYLYLMELYDKIFVVIWVWIALLILITLLYMFMLLVLACPPFSQLFLHLYTTTEGVSKLKCKVFRMCSLSDLYALHLMKNHRSESQFIYFLTKFVHNNEDSLQEVIVGSGQETLCNKQKGGNVENLQLNVGKENWEARLLKPLIPSAPAPVYSISTPYPPIGFHTDISKNDVRVRKPSTSSPKKKAPPPPPCRFGLSNYKKELEPIPEDS